MHIFLALVSLNSNNLYFVFAYVMTDIGTNRNISLVNPCVAQQQVPHTDRICASRSRAAQQ